MKGEDEEYMDKTHKVKHRVIVKVFVDFTQNMVFIGKVRCSNWFNEERILHNVREELKR